MELKELLSDVVKKAREEFGEATYRSYAIPVSFRRGEHTRPATELEQYEVSAEEWEKNREESKAHGLAAFVGKRKESYTAYEKRRVSNGWKEKLISLINSYES